MKEPFLYILPYGWMSLPTKAMRTKALLSSPYLWVVVGTPLLPLNLFCAMGFWLVTRIRHGRAAIEARSCLNVQVTYLLIFVIPLIGANYLSRYLDQANLQWDILPTLAVAIPLGIVSLIGVMGLAFFNLRLFAENAFGRKISFIPRIHFMRE